MNLHPHEIKPILNGHAFKEPQISEEKRLDVVISYYQHKYIIELKVWRGPKAHKAGLEQLADYLERQGLDAGFLLIFDHSAAKDWKTQHVRTKGKRIFAAWV
jgi:PD-(D/E)XK nuclease superfamily